MISQNLFSFVYRFNAWQISLCIFILMLICIWVGTKIGKRRLKQPGYEENPGNTTIFGAVFGLLALLLAFTFGMSGSRFDARRQAAIIEANSIGAAILRADLYPDSERIFFRRDFKDYLKARINNITAGPDFDKINAANKEANVYKDKLWRRAIEYSKVATSIVPSTQMVPALNSMFESANAYSYSELLRVPQSIILMLFLLALVSSFFVGYSSVLKGKFDWFTGVGFCFLCSLVIFITLDLDRSRRGFIQLDTSNLAIISLMKEFKNE